MLSLGTAESRIREKLYQRGADIVSVGEAFTEIRLNQIIEKQNPTGWKQTLAILRKHPYLIGLAGVLFFSGVYILEGYKGNALWMMMALASAKVLMYSITIYILDLMFQAEHKNFPIYIWIAIAVAACSVIPYSGWVFQAVILYFWLKEDLRRVATFLAAAILIDLAFLLGLAPIFMGKVA
jgi:hypothetical protein